MKASKIKKLRQKIKTWKVWFSHSAFGFSHYLDTGILWKLATPNEPKPDAIVYGLNIDDALERYKKKNPWLADLWIRQTDYKTFAKVAILPNHGIHTVACPWSLNLRKDIQFYE